MKDFFCCCVISNFYEPKPKKKSQNRKSKEPKSKIEKWLKMRNQHKIDYRLVFEKKNKLNVLLVKEPTHKMRRTFCFTVIFHWFWHNIRHELNTKLTIHMQRASTYKSNSSRSTSSSCIEATVFSHIKAIYHRPSEKKEENMVEHSRIFVVCVCECEWAHMDTLAHQHQRNTHKTSDGDCGMRVYKISRYMFFFFRWFCTAHALTCSHTLDITSAVYMCMGPYLRMCAYAHIILLLFSFAACICVHV